MTRNRPLRDPFDDDRRPIDRSEQTDSFSLNFEKMGVADDEQPEGDDLELELTASLTDAGPTPVGDTSDIETGQPDPPANFEEVKVTYADRPDASANFEEIKVTYTEEPALTDPASAVEAALPDQTEDGWITLDNVSATSMDEPDDENVTLGFTESVADPTRCWSSRNDPHRDPRSPRPPRSDHPPPRRKDQPDERTADAADPGTEPGLLDDHTVHDRDAGRMERQADGRPARLHGGRR